MGWRPWWVELASVRRDCDTLQAEVFRLRSELADVLYAGQVGAAYRAREAETDYDFSEAD